MGRKCDGSEEGKRKDDGGDCQQRRHRFWSGGDVSQKGSKITILARPVMNSRRGGGANENFQDRRHFPKRHQWVGR